jgi:hypothetical protein
MSVLIGGVVLGILMSISYVMSYKSLPLWVRQMLIRHPIVPDSLLAIFNGIMLIYSPAMLNVIGTTVASIITSGMVHIAGKQDEKTVSLNTAKTRFTPSIGYFDREAVVEFTREKHAAPR